ncbi:hypothetical protein ABXV19_10195, partial [Pseudomonas alkylphenolica]|uniref:hypothetical protein n=1 Tax=Pseudomonas alkylphenolica TaxID=237609 RepID=UPI0033952B06
FFWVLGLGAHPFNAATLLAPSGPRGVLKSQSTAPEVARMKIKSSAVPSRAERGVALLLWELVLPAMKTPRSN